jgi:hypothetical protein
VPPAGESAPSDAGEAFHHASHIHDAGRAFCVTSIKILRCLQWNCRRETAEGEFVWLASEKKLPPRRALPRIAPIGAVIGNACVDRQRGMAR